VVVEGSCCCAQPARVCPDINQFGKDRGADGVPVRLARRRFVGRHTLCCTANYLGRLTLFVGRKNEGRLELAGEVLGIVRGLAEAGMTMIVVTHEVPYARPVADWTVFVDEGVIVEQVTLSRLLDHPLTNARGVSCAGSPMRKILPPKSDLRSGARKLYMLGGG